MLNTSERIAYLERASDILDSATMRVSKAWNDRVSQAIDVNFINQIVSVSRTAISDLNNQCSSCEIDYAQLYQLGRW